MFPKLAIRNKNPLSNPACISLLPDTLDAEVLELCGIDRLNVLYLGGVDDGLTEDVSFKGLSVMAKETLKRISVVTFRSARYSSSIQIQSKYRIFVMVLSWAAAHMALH